MYVDTHAHYFDQKFHAWPGGASALLSDASALAQVKGIVNVGTNWETSHAAVAQAALYDFMVAAVGIHPEDCQSYDQGRDHAPLDPLVELPRLRAWIENPEQRAKEKIVAIGEIGLDYHWQPVDKERQMAFFEGQLQLAEELDLPVIVHDREAHGDCFEAVLRHGRVRGVFHGYSGSAEMAKELTRRGWYIAVGGAVTFKNAERLRAVVASLPLDKMLLETDCPYMAPVPYRGQLNHSGLMAATADMVAALHHISPEALAHVTAQNAAHLFGWDDFL